MDEIIEEVVTEEPTPKKLSVKGVWVKQITNSKPDFTNIKFSITYSDKSTKKYNSWDAFNADGGTYGISGNEVWGFSEYSQRITFYWNNLSSECLVKVYKQPKEFKVTSQYHSIESTKQVDIKNFKYLVTYTDGSKTRNIDEICDYISVSPNLIDKSVIDDTELTFTFNQNDFILQSTYKASITPYRYLINVLYDSSYGKGYITSLKSNKYSSSSYKYIFTKDCELQLKLKASPFKNVGFSKWICNDENVSILDEQSTETILTIPVNYGENISIEIKWGDYVDEYGNTYVIESNGNLSNVQINSTKLNIPSIVTSISSSLFKNKTALESITLSSNLKYISEECFMNCTSLKSMIIPKSVQTIKSSAFENCSALKEVIFKQEKAFNIEPSAFKGCSSLSTLNFLACGDNFKDCEFGVVANNETISKDVWEGCKLRKIKITKGNFSSILSVKHFESSDTMCVVSRFPSECDIKIISNSHHQKKFAVRSIGTTTNSDYKEIKKDVFVRTSHLYDVKGKDASKDIVLESVDYSNNYDYRDTCACVAYGDVESDIYVGVCGLGNSDFNYSYISHPTCDYRFTSLSSNDYSYQTLISRIGIKSNNWNMADYVNDLLYPNVKYETIPETAFAEIVEGTDKDKWNNVIGGSLIDFMIPLYNKRMF